jgi:hypothetical protein
MKADTLQCGLMLEVIHLGLNASVVHATIAGGSVTLEFLSYQSWKLYGLLIPIFHPQPQRNSILTGSAHRLETMPKALHKVQKHIAKKKGKRAALHENSRDSQRLQRAIDRDEKLSKVAASRATTNQSLCASTHHLPRTESRKFLKPNQCVGLTFSKMP